MIFYNGQFMFSNAPPSKISDMEIIGPGKWSILTYKDVNDTIQSSTPDAIYGLLEKWFGDESAAVYEMRCGYKFTSTLLSKFKSAIPSLYANSPEMFDHPTAYLGFYIEKLSLLIFSNNSAPTAGTSSAYHVNSDGTLSLISNSDDRYVGSFYGMSNTGILYVPVIEDYENPLDLINVDKRGYMIMTFGSTSTKISTSKYTGSLVQNVLTSMFGTNPAPPDAEINYPYEPIGPSGPTPSDSPPGTFDDESDPIPDSTLPTLSSANTGFTRIYNPTLSQVKALSNYLWTDPDVIQTIWNHIKQYFEDPMQAIIGFNLVPVPVPDGGTEEFKLMYIGTGVNMTVAASQFVDVDCGTFELKPYYGSYLDYAPYTKISCFLPYIGNVEINPDEVMGTTIQVKYRVDICAGSCVAKILVDNNCLYQYSGHCAINIPFSSADFSTYVSAAISVAKLGVGVATAGALGAAGLEAGEIAQATSAVTTTKTERNPATGRQITSGTTTVTRESTRELKPSPASYAGLTPKNVSNTVGEVMGSKPGFQHSGSFSGNTGYLGVRRPFLIITRPNLCLPESYQAMNGFPAMITMKLSECTGFTQVQQVQFSGSSATNPEQDEILQFLKSGVVF